MGAESHIRGRVVGVLRKLHAVAIENALEKGTPDVNCVAGWIEIKQLDRWPRDPERVVLLPKFYIEQRLWLRTRCEHGGSAWVLLRVEDDWMLFWGAVAAIHLGVDASRVALSKLAVAHWPDGLDEGDLMRVLLRAVPGVSCS